MSIQELLKRLSGVRQDRKEWKAICPAHDDHDPSLAIKEGDDGKILLCCRAGCATESIVTKLGLKMADLFPDRTVAKRAAKGRMVANYDYMDESGKPLFQSVRYEPKNFSQRRPDPEKPAQWIWNLNGVRLVLYRLPELKAAITAGKIIHVAEGEKDVDALVQHGFAATCNPMGAGKWSPAYSETLRQAPVCIIADKDKEGRKHARAVASSLNGVAKSIKLIELPDLNGKAVKDAADYFAAGGTAAGIRDIVEAGQEIAPVPAPESQTDLRPGSIDFATVTAWILGEILRSSQDKEALPTLKNSTIAQKVVESLAKIGRFYFHADLRDYDSAMFFDGNRKRLERIRADAFSAWLAEWLCVNRATGLFKFVLSAVETAALSGPHTISILPESYWAARPGALYLSNGDGAVVRITAGAVEEVDNGTDGVLFAAGRTLSPWRLTAPKDPFETCALFRNVHCGANHGKDLLRLWFYSFPTMLRSKPPLATIGEIGSGKTRTLKGIAELWGIPPRISKVEESLESNFWPNVNEGGLFVLDNADTKCRWLADAVAAHATDGCSPRRKLYTNSETVMLRANAWLALTSANPTFGNDAGLADRLLVDRMERRCEETSDAALTNEILANRDAGLSHIAGTLQTALADTGATPANLNARHPDFASFAVRIGRALGREAEALKALKPAEADKSAFCLENDAVGAALDTYLHQAGRFTGTAAELAPKLIELDADLKDQLSAKRLGKRLSALWPHLQKTLPNCKKETDRNGVSVFTFKSNSAGFAGFETDFSPNP